MAKLSDDKIDKFISSQKGLNKDEREILKTESEKTWFRQYAKKSKDNLKKITGKVKKGIKHGKYTYGGKREGEEQGFQLPKVKKQKAKKPKAKTQKAKTQKAKTEKPQKAKKERKAESERKYTPQTKARVEKARLKYPNASNYELRHGYNSKASQEYRERHKGE